MEGLGDIWIHLDEELLLLCQLLVADGNFISSPGAEWLPQDGVGDVDEPLTRNLVHVAVLRQIVVDPGVLSCLLEDALDAEGLVVGHVEDLDLVALDATADLDRVKGTYYLRLPVTRSLRK